VFAFLLLSAVFWTRLPLFQLRWFNPDELEHLHAAWCTGRGMVPYHDFFEHHTPWLYYLLAPVTHGGEADERAALLAISAGRSLSLVVTGGALAMLVLVGRNWQRSSHGVSGWPIGLTSAVFLAGMPIFLDKTIEIRPDVPALLLWICSLGLLVFGLKLTGADRKWSSFLAAGFCLGGAVMFTQKVLFLLPGLAAAGLVWVFFGGSRSDVRYRALCAACCCVGVLTPFLLTWAFFTTQGAGFAFLESNFLLNARWRAAEPPQPFLWYIANDNWPILLLAVGGVVLLFRDLLRRNPDWAGVLLLSSAASLLLGLLIIPVAMAQYYLPLLPIIALFAARFFVAMIDLLPARLRWVYACPVLAMLQIAPVNYALETRYRTNAVQLADLTFVMSHSSPDDTVMDGWRGMGVFRPHAWYYYFLHPEARGMLPPQQLERFLDDLEAGRVAPKLIVMDNNLRALSDRFVAFVQQNYHDAGNDIWVRKEDRSNRSEQRDQGGEREGGDTAHVRAHGSGSPSEPDLQVGGF
jgi:hypothetical protein